MLAQRQRHRRWPSRTCGSPGADKAPGNGDGITTDSTRSDLDKAPVDEAFRLDLGSVLESSL